MTGEQASPEYKEIGDPGSRILQGSWQLLAMRDPTIAGGKAFDDFAIVNFCDPPPRKSGYTQISPLRRILKWLLERPSI